MGDEEVVILGVDYSSDCLCLSRNKDKIAADITTTRRRRRKTEKVTPGTKRSANCLTDEEDCLIILDDNSTESEEDYDCIEVDSGGREVGGGDLEGLHPTIEDDGGRGRDHDNRGDDSPASKLPHHSNGSTNLLHVSTEQHSNVNDLHVSQVGGLLQKETETELQSHRLAGNPSSVRSGQFALTPDESTQHLQEQELASLITSKDQTVPSQDRTPSPLFEPMVSVVSELRRTPKCWTSCPNCPPNAERKFHLIDVVINSAEWTFVSSQLLSSGFTVTRIKRIQNDSLWQRLCYEKQLMLRDKKGVNEQLLYHTSRSPVEVICEEGLDLRLSMDGCFGHGIYFSDDPFKCNRYWHGGVAASRYMFCCRVLLGDIKMYPKGKAERLKREPRKERLKPGEHNKYYDSVMGNLSGQNEFVVYNAYRVMPEYVLYYMLPTPEFCHASQPTASQPTPSSSSSVAYSFARLTGTGSQYIGLPGFGMSMANLFGFQPSAIPLPACKTRKRKKTS